MGASLTRGKDAPPVLAISESPMYALKKIGPRHLLVGGGGGAAKTGVANFIETFLISSKKSFETCSVPSGARSAAKLDTSTFATMNMDVVCISSVADGKYLIAAGHDEYCDVYETIGMETDKDTNELSFKFREVGRLRTDEKANGAYQKCVRFDKSTGGQRLITGGADGHIRVWDIKALSTNRNPEVQQRPLIDIAAHNAEVDDVDISPDGRLILSVSSDGTFLWDITTGKKVKDLPYPPEVAKGFRVRSARFTSLGGNNVFFVIAYNTILRTKQEKSYLSLWGFSRERQACRPFFVRQAANGGAISALTVSSCGNFTGVGFMSGSTAIFDTDELQCRLFSKEPHKGFVTGLEFLDRVVDDVILPGPSQDKRRLIPGPAAAYKACLVSISTDRTLQIHALPFDSPSLTAFLVKLSMASLFVYLIIFLLSQL